MERRVAYLIFLIAFALRIGAAVSLPDDRALFPDSHEYIRVADNFLAGEGLILNSEALAKRPPVYPVFLALHRALFGGALFPVQATHAFLGALSCVLLMLLATPIFGRRTGIAAALVLAVSPLHLATSGAILIETLFTFLLLLEIFLLWRAVHSREWKWAIAAGLVAGTATLLQAGHALFILFAVPFVIRAMRPRRVGLTLLLFVGCAMILPCFWAARNLIVLQRIVPLSTHSGYTLYESFGPGATGGSSGDRMFWPEKGDLGEVDYDALLRSRAWSSATGEPGRSLRLSLEKQRRFWNFLPNFSEFRSTTGILVTVSFAPILLLFLLGLFRIRRIGWDAAWFVAPVLYFALLHTVFLGSIRYRLPIEPYLIALAAWTVVDFLDRIRKPARE